MRVGRWLYKCEYLDVVQFLPELPTNHDRYVNFYRQAKELPMASAKVGGVAPHTPYFDTLSSPWQAVIISVFGDYSNDIFLEQNMLLR